MCAAISVSVKVSPLSLRLPQSPVPNPRTHRRKGPVGPTPPAFWQDLFHPPGDSHLLVRGNDIALVGCVHACCETRVYDLEWGDVPGLQCDRADDFMHLCRGEHRGEGQVAPDGDDTVP